MDIIYTWGHHALAYWEAFLSDSICFTFRPRIGRYIVRHMLVLNKFELLLGVLHCNLYLIWHFRGNSIRFTTNWGLNLCYSIVYACNRRIPNNCLRLLGEMFNVVDDSIDECPWLGVTQEERLDCEQGLTVCGVAIGLRSWVARCGESCWKMRLRVMERDIRAVAGAFAEVRSGSTSSGPIVALQFAHHLAEYIRVLSLLLSTVICSFIFHENPWMYYCSLQSILQPFYCCISHNSIIEFAHTVACFFVQPAFRLPTSEAVGKPYLARYFANRNNCVYTSTGKPPTSCPIDTLLMAKSQVEDLI